MKLHCWCATLLVASLLLTAPVARAQEEKKAEEKSWPVRLFQVKYADVYHLANLFRAFGAVVQPEGDMKALSVRAPKEVLAAIEESLQRLDVPQAPARNIQLDAYLLTASVQGPSGNIPAELDPVVKQLKNVFSYQNFHLLGTLSWRGRDSHGGRISGLLSPLSPDSAQPTSYVFQLHSAAITSEGKERTIRVDDLVLQLEYSLKGNSQIRQASIGTSIDVREGQKVVVGKANIDNADNALILVLAAKVVE